MEALHIALALLADPVLVHKAQQNVLPQDVTLLLELAAGDEAATVRGRHQTGLEEPALREAADFFIEQILFDYQADSYRTLGCPRTATHEELRRNMALLMRWLHPDLHATRNRAAADREVFVTRVSRAWEDLKSEERRKAYDRQTPTAVGSAHPSASKHPRGRSAIGGLPLQRTGMPGVKRASGPRPRLSMRRLEGDTFWVRLFRLLRRSP